jgi:3-phosphoinositide dependent protein kinase-1
MESPALEHTSSRASTTSSTSSKRDHKDFEFGKILGEGSYSTVLLAKETSTSTYYAVKMLDKNQLIKERKTKFAAIEKHCLRTCDSPFVAKVYWTFQDTYSLYFVLEYAPNGDMLEYIKGTGRFDVKTVAFYAGEILLGLEHVHSKEILHRDLKPEVCATDAEHLNRCRLAY